MRPHPGGGAIVLVEDERNAAGMARVPGLSAVIAVARILNARRVLETRFGGKGEIRYAVGVTPPVFLSDAVTRAGASLCDAAGERVLLPGSPAAISAVIDPAFAELAHHVRTNVAAPDVAGALRKVEATRRKAVLDRDASPAAYWTAVFELMALAGELSRPRGGRWIETGELPVPFALRFASGELARPAKLAQQIVEGGGADESLAV
ncbi:MAG TPA: hypothetical protein VN253_29485 [Kofleriaceae bacterium]|nr:hypothetical protein [Kofleriaceae bacterium]